MARWSAVFAVLVALVLVLAGARDVPDQVPVDAEDWATSNDAVGLDDQKNFVLGESGGYSGFGGAAIGGLPVLARPAGGVASFGGAGFGGGGGGGGGAGFGGGAGVGVGGLGGGVGVGAGVGVVGLGGGVGGGAGFGVGGGIFP